MNKQHNPKEELPPKQIQDNQELSVSVDVLTLVYCPHPRYCVARYHYGINYWEGVFNQDVVAWWYLPEYIAGEQ